MKTRVMVLLFIWRHVLWCYCSYEDTCYGVIVQMKTHVMVLLFIWRHVLWCCCSYEDTRYGVIVHMKTCVRVLLFIWRHVLGCYCSYEYTCYGVIVHMNTRVKLLLFIWTHVCLAWGDPADKSLQDQYAIDTFYRFQVMAHFHITPGFQLLVNPSNDPDNDVEGILAIRARITFWSSSEIETFLFMLYKFH